MTKEERKEKLNKYKPYIQLGITAFVELFTGAVSNSVLKNVEGGKVSRFGAWIGGGLIGLKIGDEVSEYVFNNIEHFIDNMEEIKETIDESKEGA